MYKNLIIKINNGVYTAEHTNGKLLSFNTDSLQNAWLVARLKWFDEHGTMAGY